MAISSIGTSEPLWRGLGAVPWADCRSGTNELIGEDPPVIIRLGGRPVNELDLLSLNWGQMLYPPGDDCSSFTPGNECLHCCVCACELLIVSAL